MGLVGLFGLSHVIAAIAFAVTGYVTEAMGLLSTLAVAASTAIAFYFGLRTGENENKPPAQPMFMPFPFHPPEDEEEEEDDVHAMGFSAPVPRPSTIDPEDSP